MDSTTSDLPIGPIAIEGTAKGTLTTSNLSVEELEKALEAYSTREITEIYVNVTSAFPEELQKAQRDGIKTDEAEKKMKEAFPYLKAKLEAIHQTHNASGENNTSKRPEHNVIIIPRPIGNATASPQPHPTHGLAGLQYSNLSRYNGALVGIALGGTIAAAGVIAVIVCIVHRIMNKHGIT